MEHIQQCSMQQAFAPQPPQYTISEYQLPDVGASDSHAGLLRASVIAKASMFTSKYDDSWLF